ncbi:hypothetical protein CYPRO_2330 [Cyclonatronum proteinivorum]|uniref:Uncharacterized protein n=1 Tax=Cyclonatronum proteinivorum TaxID=1457365 RepID=A0A345UM73_9BACT|nr:hypothetical protein [Cyclonatronum proteinivorum]AXJ01575.1 hypothetical protein CYPRO_2330 [Cyclonatronum proteinivorum]
MVHSYQLRKQSLAASLLQIKDEHVIIIARGNYAQGSARTAYDLHAPQLPPNIEAACMRILNSLPSNRSSARTS